MKTQIVVSNTVATCPFCNALVTIHPNPNHFGVEGGCEHFKGASEMDYPSNSWENMMFIFSTLE